MKSGYRIQSLEKKGFHALHNLYVHRTGGINVWSSVDEKSHFQGINYTNSLCIWFDENWLTLQRNSINVFIISSVAFHCFLRLFTHICILCGLPALEVKFSVYHWHSHSSVKWIGRPIHPLMKWSGRLASIVKLKCYTSLASNFPQWCVYYPLQPRKNCPDSVRQQHIKWNLFVSHPYQYDHYHQAIKTR